MNKEEDAFLKQVLQYANVCKWRVAHFRPAMMPNGHWITAGLSDSKGFPDVFAVRDSRIVAAELKTEEGEMFDEQIDWMVALWSAGVDCYLWRPSQWEQIKAILQ